MNTIQSVPAPYVPAVNTFPSSRLPFPPPLFLFPPSTAPISTQVPSMQVPISTPARFFGLSPYNLIHARGQAKLKESRDYKNIF